MKLAIVAVKKTYESQRILGESKNFFEKGEVILLPEITVKIKEEATTFFHQGRDLAQTFDLFLIRGTGKYGRSAVLLADFMFNRGKIVVDEKLAKPRGAGPKFSTLIRLARKGISVPDTFQAFSKEKIFEEAKKLNYHLVIKNVKSRRGKGVYKIDSEKKITQFLNEHPDFENYFFQQFLNSNFDVRVFIVGNQVLGAMKRVAPPGDFRSNIAVGGRGEKFSASTEINDIALKSSRVMKNEIAGVDIMITQKPYLIEVNRAPQFQAFEKITDINVAKKICEYLHEKGKNG
jgi:RimK family alpha-L-glutamate ligase